METNYMLAQGKKYKGYKRDYSYIIGNKSIKRIQKTSVPGLKNINLTEGFNTINNNENKITSEILDLKNSFDKKLGSYINEYTKQITNIEKNNDLIDKYKGKIVDNGEYYYINRFGVARGYSGNLDPWNKKPSSCPNKVIPKTVQTEMDFKLFKKGLNYNPGQPCNLDGNIVKNTTTNKIAWIDIYGTMFEFPNEDVFKKSKCSNRTVKPIKDEIYNTFTKSHELNETNTCHIINIGSYNNIEILNNELINISNQIFEKLQELQKIGYKMDKRIYNIKDELNNNIKILSEHRKKIENQKTRDISLDAELHDNKIELRSKYYEYIFWTIGAVSVGCYVIYKGTK
jgi:hypothetical protein